MNTLLSLPEATLPYPRVCAHRGFNTVAPENSLPAFGAAIGLGADEIEFDLWQTKDGVIVSIHDNSLDRVSNGTGFVWEHTYAQLLELDFGTKCRKEYAGLKIITFREILEKFARQAVMNIHIKPRTDTDPLPESYLLEIGQLLEEYHCQEHCYFMTGSPVILRQLQQLLPHIPRCAGASAPEIDLVEKALATGCSKIQLFKPHFETFPPEYLPEIIARAHKNGLRVNVFYSDDPEETRKYLELGADTVLTNDYFQNALAAQSFR